MSPISTCRGFSLIETVVATGIVVTALAGIAQLLVLSAQLTRQASGSNAALIAAQDKLEALRAAAFRYDEAGAAVTDPALQPSPADVLSENTEPYVDWIDIDGDVVDAPDDAVWTRRWRVSSLGSGAPDAIAIEVCVLAERVPDVCLATVRTRQP